MTKEFKFLVIADYPAQNKRIGDIIITYESCMAYVTDTEKVCLLDYPALFKKIEPNE